MTAPACFSTSAYSAETVIVATSLEPFGNLDAEYPAVPVTAKYLTGFYWEDQRDNSTVIFTASRGGELSQESA